MPIFRTILALARPAALPTVWSNCLAGWWLGGGGHLDHFPFLFSGVTLLFLGGAFLNDAFDLDLDRQHRPERPIPSGKISQKAVWRTGLTLLTLGALLLLWPGHRSAAVGLALAALIVLYNSIHSLFHISPVLQALCRFTLYLLGASLATRGITGWALWCGLALAIYTTGAGYFSSPPGKPGSRQYWPLFLLVAPIGLALVMNVGEYRESGLLLSAILVLWIVRGLRHTFWSLEPRPRQTMAALTAAIVFVDWLATCPAILPGQASEAPKALSLVFLGLFGLTLLLQKVTPEN